MIIKGIDKVTTFPVYISLIKKNPFKGIVKVSNKVIEYDKPILITTKKELEPYRPIDIFLLIEYKEEVKEEVVQEAVISEEVTGKKRKTRTAKAVE